jgi:CheY-like chemotaxis protein
MPAATPAAREAIRERNNQGFLDARSRAHIRAGVAKERLQQLASLYRQRPPSVILTDIEMEGGDGYALVRRIREMERGTRLRTPAIALTARTRDADRLRARSAGFQMHLPKPVNPVELVFAIANLAQPGFHG